MKNIHVLPTDKPSTLYLGNNGNFVFGMMQTSTQSINNDFTNQTIYITSDEEIKEGDWIYYTLASGYCKTTVGSKELKQKGIHAKKIILTTDTYMIKDGVQAIDDEFLEWFVKNPNCESVKWNAYPISPNGNIVATNRPYPFKGLISNFKIEYKIIIPNLEIPEFGTKDFNDLASVYFGGKPKQEILEEAAENFRKQNPGTMQGGNNTKILNAFKAGARWMQEKMYSEEDMRLSFETGRNFQLTGENNFNELIDQFKKK